MNHNDRLLDPNDYLGQCFTCKNYYDYGPVAGRFKDYNGKCLVDGHETNSLVKCKINSYSNANQEKS